MAVDYIEEALEATVETEAFNKCNEKKTAFVIFRILVQFPILCFVLSLGAFTIVGGLTYWKYQCGEDIFAFDFEQLPLRLDHDIDRRRDLAWRERNKYPGYLNRILVSTFRPHWIRGFVADNVDIILVHTDNLLTEKYLRNIQFMEEQINAIGNYTYRFCQKLYDGKCVKPSSVLRFFDGTFSHVDDAFDDLEFLNVTETIYKASHYNETKQLLKLVTGSDAKFTNDSVFANTLKIRFPIGTPLTYRSTYRSDRPKYIDFLENHIQPMLVQFQTDKSHEFTVYYISDILFIIDLQKQAFLDLYWAIGSLSFIFVYMLIHTESIWITIWSTFSIGMSFLWVNFLYRFVLGYAYFGFFHILSIFIILGIGADDIFIFFDIWRHNCSQSFPSNAHRLAATYQRASVSMLATSLTTMAAFMVSYISPLLAVSTFGLYSGLLVLVNFIAVITFFPTVVMVYSLRILPFINGCWQMFVSEGPDRDFMNICDFSRNPVKVIPRIGYSVVMTYITKFLVQVYYPFVTWKPVKIIVSFFFVGLVAIFVVFAVRLKPDETEVQMFRSSHNYGQGQYLRTYGFGAINDEDLTKVRLTWGLKAKDTSNCETTTSTECIGKPVFDDQFNMSSPETQMAVLNVCRLLRNLTDQQIDDLRIKRNTYTNKPEIACFMESMQEFFWREQDRLNKSGDRIYPLNYTFNMPFTQEHLTTVVEAKAKEYSILRGLQLKRPLENAIGYWLSKGWSKTPDGDYFTYKNLLGEVILPDTKSILGLAAFSYNTGLKYIGIEINTTVFINKLGVQEGKPIRDKWENQMQDILKDMPAPLSNGFQETKDTWHWLRIQETLSESAVNGLTIGLALALPILIIATQNVVIGLLATLTISLVTICVVGVIPIAGWRLGVLESLNLCLVVGLSVDYVVHMAEAYHRCEHPGRNERVKHMLETVGSAVLSGAITTGGAAVFMLFAQIQFLVEFGVFMLSTIGFSVLFSLLGFTVLMAICGPQGDTGSLVALFKKCKEKIMSKHTTPLPTHNGFHVNRSTEKLDNETSTMQGNDNPGFVRQTEENLHTDIRDVGVKEDSPTANYPDIVPQTIDNSSERLNEMDCQTRL